MHPAVVAVTVGELMLQMTVALTAVDRWLILLIGLVLGYAASQTYEAFADRRHERARESRVLQQLPSRRSAQEVEAMTAIDEIFAGEAKVGAE